MVKVKTVAIIVLALLALVLVVQNTETIETRLLFFTLRMPRAALLLITLAVGFSLGVIVSLVLSGRRAGKPGNASRSRASD
jgi:uncharacterized integral membrane protein